MAMTKKQTKKTPPTQKENEQKEQEKQTERNLSSRKLARVLKKQQRERNKKEKSKLTRAEKKILKERNKVIYFYTVLPTAALSEFATNPPPLNDDGTYSLYQDSSGTGIDSQILTVATTYEEALEYIRTCLILSHFTHYKNWCEIHGHTQDTEKLRTDYILTTLDMSNPANQFSVIKVAYSHADIGILLRSALHCIPIGCSYDDPLERHSFLQQDQSMFKQANKKKEEEKKEREDTSKQSAPKNDKEKRASITDNDPKKRNHKA